MDTQLKAWHKSSLPVHRKALEKDFRVRKRDIEQEEIQIHSHPIMSKPLDTLDTGDLFTVAAEVLYVTRKMVLKLDKQDLTIETIPLCKILELMDPGSIGSSVYHTKSLYEDFWRIYKQHIQNYARNHIEACRKWDNRYESNFFEQLTLVNAFTNNLYLRYVKTQHVNGIPVYLVFQYMNILIMRRDYDANKDYRTKTQQTVKQHKRRREDLESDISSLQWLCPSMYPASNTLVDELFFKVILPKLNTNERLLNKRQLEDSAIVYIQRQYPETHHHPLTLRVAQAQDEIRSREGIQAEEDDKQTLLDNYSLVLESFQDKTVGISFQDYKAIMHTMAQQPDEVLQAIPVELPPLQDDPVFERSLYDLDVSILRAMEDILNQQHLITEEAQRVLLNTVKDRFLRQAPEESKHTEEDEQETPTESLSRRLLDMEVIHYRIYMANRMYKLLTDYTRGVRDVMDHERWIQVVVDAELQFQCNDGGAFQYMNSHSIPWKQLQSKLREEQRLIREDQVLRLQQRMDTLTWTQDTLKKQILTQHQRNKEIYNKDITDTTFPATHINRYQNHRIPASWLITLIPSLSVDPGRILTCSEVYREFVLGSTQGVDQYDKHSTSTEKTQNSIDHEDTEGSSNQIDKSDRKPPTSSDLYSSALSSPLKRTRQR